MLLELLIMLYRTLLQDQAYYAQNYALQLKIMPCDIVKFNRYYR